MVKADGFIEHAEFSGNMYGTSVAAVQAVGQSGDRVCILDIDTQVRLWSLHRYRFCHPSAVLVKYLDTGLIRANWIQGVKLIKSNHAHLAPLYVFISPPSLASLHSRLTGRGTESEKSLAARLAAAHGELDYAKSGAFDRVVVNDDLDRAYRVLKSIIIDGSKEGDALPTFEA